MTNPRRQNLTVAIPVYERERIHQALQELADRFPYLSISAIIVNIVADDQFVPAVSVRQGGEPRSIRRGDSISISIPTDRHDAFFAGLERWKQQYNEDAQNAVILRRIVDKAQESIDVLPRDDAALFGPTILYQRDGSFSFPDFNREETRVDILPESWKDYYRGEATTINGWIAFYSAKLPDREKQALQLIQQLPKLSHPERAVLSEDLDALTRGFQFLAVVHTDREEYDEAFAAAEKAIQYAEQMQLLDDKRAGNMTAVAYYRRLGILHQFAAFDTDDAQSRWRLLVQSDVETVKELLPSCRPVVAAVIAVRLAEIIVRCCSGTAEKVLPLLRFALDNVTVEPMYDNSGVMVSRAGVLHTWARVSLVLAEQHRAPTAGPLSLAAASVYMEQAIAHIPPQNLRWITGMRITHMHINALMQLRLYEAARPIATVIADLQRSQSRVQMRAINAALQHYRTLMSYLLADASELEPLLTE